MTARRPYTPPEPKPTERLRGLYADRRGRALKDAPTEWCRRTGCPCATDQAKLALAAAFGLNGPAGAWTFIVEFVGRPTAEGGTGLLACRMVCPECEGQGWRPGAAADLERPCETCWGPGILSYAGCWHRLEPNTPKDHP
jgi:hypothetical protein